MSQSEHDWAFAKRALARGDDAEEVVRKIAEHRAGDKPNPEYYARLTVTKSAAEFTSSSHTNDESGPEPKH
jgi:hypothetical protein